MKTQTYIGTLEAVTCGECGIIFGMEQNFRAKRIEDHKTFYCPNGHPRAYRGETEADRYKRWYEQEKQQRTEANERAEKQRRRRIALQGVVTRTKRRIGNGVCPCCGRTFKELARHMADKHPDYGNGGSAD